MRDIAHDGERASLSDAAADRLRESSRAFTRRNLFHAARRLARERGELFERDFERFAEGPLGERLREGPIPGLLLEGGRRPGRVRLPREYDAYFPAAILLVDRARVVDLFAASGILVQARVAVVALDGYPGHVTAWLCRGLRAGLRAPVGYLHDSASIAHPFVLEPLRTYLDVATSGELAYRDLGAPPEGGAPDLFGKEAPRELVLELEQLPPHVLISYAARAVLAMTPRDSMLEPTIGARRRRAAV
jgi:hypothetical protein